MIGKTATVVSRNLHSQADGQLREVEMYKGFREKGF